MTTATAPATYSAIRRRIQPNTEILVSSALLPTHTRTVRRVTSQGYYFRTVLTAGRGGFTAWGRARNVTIHSATRWTVHYRTGDVTYEIRSTT